MNNYLTKHQIAKNVIFGITSPLFLNFPIRFLRTKYLSIFLKSLGNNCFIGKNLDIRNPSKISIGNNVVINKRVLLDGRGGLTIEDNVDIAQDARIWTEQHDYQDENHSLVDAPVYIENHVWICANSSILPGVRISQGAVVALGAVVSKNVAPMTVVAGIPAKVINKRINTLQYKLHYTPKFFEIQ